MEFLKLHSNSYYFANFIASDISPSIQLPLFTGFLDIISTLSRQFRGLLSDFLFQESDQRRQRNVQRVSQGKRRASTMNIYPLAILFRCSELRIDIASFYTTEGGRSIERSFNVFLKLLWTVPVESPSISRASIVVNPNTRNIRSFSIETSLLNGTTSFFSE